MSVDGSKRQDRPGETTEATNHNTHSHRQQADTPEGTSAGGVGEGVYARAYPIYDQRGWPNSLKLPPGRKKSPPDRDENDAKTHYTGNQAKTPGAELEAKWARQQPERQHRPAHARMRGV